MNWRRLNRKLNMIMVAKSSQRGHEIEYLVGQWCYSDTGELADCDRPCKRCGKMPTVEGYDACTGYIVGVRSVCCGHGVHTPFIMPETNRMQMGKVTPNKLRGGKVNERIPC